MKNISVKRIVFALAAMLCISVYGTSLSVPNNSTSQTIGTFSEVFVTNSNSCYGLADATAMVSTFAGVTPYSFSWSNGQYGPDASGLAAGFHTVTVSEGGGGSDVLEFYVIGPDSIQIGFTQIGYDTLKAHAQGGLPPYNYVWDSGFQGDQITGVGPGVHSVTVTDVNGCTQIDEYQISIPGPNWPVNQTNFYHKIIIPDTINLLVNGKPLEAGDHIGVFYDSLACGGKIIWNGTTDTLYAYGDETATISIVEGFLPNQEFVWKIWDASEDEVFKTLVHYNPQYPATDLWNIYETSALTNMQGYVTHDLGVPEGWSMFSTYIEPFDPSIEVVFADVLPDIILIKDENGGVFHHPFGINTIGDLEIGNGYQIKMDNQSSSGGTKSTSDFTIYVNGVRVDADSGINLRDGWNILGYLHTDEYPISTMLSSIETYIDIVKDGEGNVYIPYIPVNTIQNMKPGKGYKIKILSGNNIIFHYPDSIPGTKSPSLEKKPSAPNHFKGVKNTGNNHTILIPGNSLPSLPEKGDEIGVFSNGQKVGAATYFEGYFALAVFGDDETTDVIDGPKEGETLSFKYWDASAKQEYDIRVENWQTGDDKYEIEKVSIAEKAIINNLLSEVNVTIMPNPNHGTFIVEINTSAKVEGLSITNALGQVLYRTDAVESLFKRLEFTDYSPGAYMLNVSVEGKTIQKKIVIQR